MEKEIITIGVGKLMSSVSGRFPPTILLVTHGALDKEALFELNSSPAIKLYGEPIIHHLEVVKDFPTDLKSLSGLLTGEGDDVRRVAAAVQTMEDNGQFYSLHNNRGLWLTKNHGYQL